jgi:hypothetical protein
MVLINAVEAASVILASGGIFLGYECLRLSRRDAQWADALPAPARFVAVSYVRRDVLRILASVTVFCGAAALVVSPNYLSPTPDWGMARWYFAETALRAMVLLHACILVLSSAWDLWDRRTVTDLPDCS